MGQRNGRRIGVGQFLRSNKAPCGTSHRGPLSFVLFHRRAFALFLPVVVIEANLHRIRGYSVAIDTFHCYLNPAGMRADHAVFRTNNRSHTVRSGLDIRLRIVHRPVGILPGDALNRCAIVDATPSVTGVLFHRFVQETF